MKTIRGELLQSWISVKENLPEIGERVLIYCESQGVQICYLDINKKWRMAFDMSEAFLNITDWMYLPTIPNKTKLNE